MSRAVCRSTERRLQEFDGKRWRGFVGVLKKQAQDISALRGKLRAWKKWGMSWSLGLGDVPSTQENDKG